ncbi:MST4 [Scenedesmus sp. PABB004]|nr:MST4 [Scenedesmus sp. PABB004]
MGLLPKRPAGAPAEPPLWPAVKAYVLRNYLPLAFLVAFVVAMAWPLPGRVVLSPSVMGVHVVTFINICIVFFISGLTLNTNELRAAFTRTAALGTVFGLVSIVGITPLLGFAVRRLPLAPAEYVAGLTIFTVVPTTLGVGISLATSAKARGAARRRPSPRRRRRAPPRPAPCPPPPYYPRSPSARARAQGNVGLAIFLTVASNVIGVVLVPLWLKVMLGRGASVLALELDINILDMFVKLLLSNFVPTLLGKVLRDAVPPVAAWAKAHRTELGLTLSSARDLIVGTSFGTMLLVLLTALLIHIAYLIFNSITVTLMRVPPPEAVSTIIMSSQKSAPVAVTAITYLTPDPVAQGLLAVPAVTGQLLQIFVGQPLAHYMAGRVSRWRAAQAALPIAAAPSAPDLRADVADAQQMRAPAGDRAPTGSRKRNQVTPAVWVVLWATMTAGYAVGFIDSVAMSDQSQRSFISQTFTQLAARGLTLGGVNRGKTLAACEPPEPCWCSAVNTARAWFVAVRMLASAVATLPAAWTCRLFGRKVVWCAANALFLAGMVLQAASFQWAQLLVGNLLVGAGASTLLLAAFLEVAEVSPPRWRGAGFAAVALGRQAGMCVALVVMKAVADADVGPHGWRAMVAMAGWPSAVMLLLLCWLPETPHSLVQRGRLTEGREMLFVIRGPFHAEQIDAELMEIWKAAGRPSGAVRANAHVMAKQLRALVHRPNLPPLIAGCMLAASVEVSGHFMVLGPALVGLLPVMFNANALLDGTAVLGATCTVAGLVAVVVALRFSPRRMIAAGCAIGALTWAGVGALLVASPRPLGRGATTAALVLYLTNAAASVGGLWAMAPAVYTSSQPLATRAHAVGLALAVDFFMRSLSTAIRGTLLCRMGTNVIWVATGTTAGVMLFAVAALPEGRAEPLESLARAWERHWLWRRFYARPPPPAGGEPGSGGEPANGGAHGVLEGQAGRQLAAAPSGGVALRGPGGNPLARRAPRARWSGADLANAASASLKPDLPPRHIRTHVNLLIAGGALYTGRDTTGAALALAKAPTPADAGAPAAGKGAAPAEGSGVAPAEVDNAEGKPAEGKPAEEVEPHDAFARDPVAWATSLDPITLPKACREMVYTFQDSPGQAFSLDPVQHVETLVTHLLGQQEKDYAQLGGSKGLQKSVACGSLQHTVTACLYLLPSGPSKLDLATMAALARHTALLPAVTLPAGTPDAEAAAGQARVRALLDAPSSLLRGLEPIPLHKFSAGSASLLPLLLPPSADAPALQGVLDLIGSAEVYGLLDDAYDRYVAFCAAYEARDKSLAALVRDESARVERSIGSERGRYSRAAVRELWDFAWQEASTTPSGSRRYSCIYDTRAEFAAKGDWPSPWSGKSASLRDLLTKLEEERKEEEAAAAAAKAAAAAAAKAEAEAKAAAAAAKAAAEAKPAAAAAQAAAAQA